MSRAGFLIDDRFLFHETGPRHPESPRRLSFIQQALDEFSVAGRWQRIPARPAELRQVELAHSRTHIERVKHASEIGPSFLDPDTRVSTGSFDAALLAVGGVLACVDAIRKDEVKRAFAFIRPPGHHAGRDRAMGFCLFNNVALAAIHLQREHGLQRVAIVDFDVHHGNGTQECFYGDPGVLFISTHQYPFYPGTGAFDETGVQEGWGYTLNFPLPAGAGDSVFVPIYSRIIAPVLQQYRPQFILVSAGFDAFKGDPMGGLAISAAGYAAAAAALLEAALFSCDGEICFVLEGGYSPEGLRECTKAVLAQMESDQPALPEMPEDPLFEAISRHAKGEFGEHWQWS